MQTIKKILQIKAILNKIRSLLVLVFTSSMPVNVMMNYEIKTVGFELKAGLLRVQFQELTYHSLLTIHRSLLSFAPLCNYR